MTEPTTLDCRLLCASQVSAEIQGGQLDPNPCYYDRVGWQEKPVVLVGGDDDIDAGLVGTTADGVVAAFRGTLATGFNWPSILDWLQNLLAVDIEVKGLPGRVHAGFHHAVEKVWDQVLAKVSSRAEGRKVYVTGHSKGAAMATLVSLRLQLAGIPIEKVVTIASPNAGNAAFATAYDQAIRQTRYTGYHDIVPFVPPTRAEARVLERIPDIGWLLRAFELVDYTAVGNGVYLGKGGTPAISEADDPDGYRQAIARDLAGLVDEFAKGPSKELLQSISHAHNMQCGLSWSYMQGICQDTVCSSPDCPGT